MPSNELSEERKALMAKTAQLRELRLAKEAEDLEAAKILEAEKAARPKSGKAVSKKAPKKVRTHAAWPWEKSTPKED